MKGPPIVVNSFVPWSSGSLLLHWENSAERAAELHGSHGALASHSHACLKNCFWGFFSHDYKGP